jgi:CBS domain-containing protein
MNTKLVQLDADATALEAAKQMRDRDVGNVLVIHEGGLRGIVTDRDLVTRCLADGQGPEKTRLGDLCTEDLVTVQPDASIGDAVRTMTERAVRRLPVMDGERPVGIVSLGDLAVLQDRKSALGEISAARPNN